LLGSHVIPRRPASGSRLASGINFSDARFSRRARLIYIFVDELKAQCWGWGGDAEASLLTAVTAAVIPTAVALQDGLVHWLRREGGAGNG